MLSLKTDPKYKDIDIDVEFKKAVEWINKNKGRTFTKRFFKNWLNRVEPPIIVTKTAKAAF